MSASRGVRVLKSGKKFHPKITVPGERAKLIKVPHKRPPNNTYEMHWQFNRYVCQLKRLTFNYCPHNGDSRGLRRFIDFEVDEFIEKTPQVAVYINPRSNKPPRLVANYLNGQDRIIGVPNHDNQAIWEWLGRLVGESGREWRSTRLHQPWITATPSMQGVWTPFTNKPPIDINKDNYVVK